MGCAEVPQQRYEKRVRTRILNRVLVIRTSVLHPRFLHLPRAEPRSGMDLYSLERALDAFQRLIQWNSFMRFLLVSPGATVEFLTLRLDYGEAIRVDCRLGSDAIPQVLDELDALGDGQLQ